MSGKLNTTGQAECFSSGAQFYLQQPLWMLANDLAGLQEVLQGISQAGDIKFAARMTVFRDADKKSPHCQEQQYGLVERLFWRCTPFKLSKTNASNKFYIIQSLVFFLAGLVHHKQPEWFNLAGFYFQQAVN